MKKIKRKSVEMRRPDYKFCHYCDRKVKQEEIICPSCGRSLVRSLKGMGKAEVLAEESESCFCGSQKRQGSRISFEQVAEELETSFAVGTIFKNT